MGFKEKNIRAIAEMVIGNVDYFPYRSSSLISEFFEDCNLNYIHDGSTRWWWTSRVLKELLNEPQPSPNKLPDNFSHLLRVLMDKADAEDDDNNRSKALKALNEPLQKEGYEAFYGEDDILYIRHIGTEIISNINQNSHRPLTPDELSRKKQLDEYLSKCSEDELIADILLPLFRQLGYQRVTENGHKDKSLEYGKDAWMRYVLPTQHILYFGIQVKIGKLDAAGMSRGSNTNIAEIYNQALMMLGHEIFDPETNKKNLVDHAFIISSGEITKQAKNWLAQKLDASKRSQILFIDRNDILNLYTTSCLSLPAKYLPDNNISVDDTFPF